MPISLNQKTASFANGQPNDATPLEQQLVALFNNDAQLQQVVNQLLAGRIPDSRTLTLNQDNATPPQPTDHVSIQAFRGGLGTRAIRWNETEDRWELTHDGTTYLPIQWITATDPAILPPEGTLWLNTTQKSLKLSVNGAVHTLYGSHQPAPMPPRYQGSTPPVYTATTALTVDQIYCRSHANDAELFKATPTTLLTTQVGLNGVARSEALPGTVSVTSGSNTVTGAASAFSSDFAVGDIVTTAGGQSRRVVAVASNGSLTVAGNFTGTETDVAYFRGGLAPDTDYYLYALRLSDTTVGLILSPRSVANSQTLIDLPTTTSAWRQFPFAVRVLPNLEMAAWRVGPGWPQSPQIYYTRLNVSGTYTPVRSLSGQWIYQGGENIIVELGTPGSTFTTATAVCVPRIARLAHLHVQVWNGDTAVNHVNAAAFRESATRPQVFVCAPSDRINMHGVDALTVPIDANQQFQYAAVGTNPALATITLATLGYVVTAPC